jgi:hypothetical protein
MKKHRENIDFEKADDDAFERLARHHDIQR